MDENHLAHLLAKARERDPDSLAALCERFYPKVLKYMHYRVDATWADDLTAEVFLRVMRSIAGQTGSFVAWLYKIAANVIIDHSRREKVRRVIPMDEQTTQLLTSPDDPADTVARRADLLDALAWLTEEQRELVTLKFIQGLSNAEIAEVTGRKPGAIRALQFRALSALRERLEQDDAGDVS